MKILVTGAAGFVGGGIIDRLIADGIHQPVALLRKKKEESSLDCTVIEAGNIESIEDWSSFLSHVDIVIHAAARVHVMNQSSVASLSEFRKINVDTTLKLAATSAVLGVKRFIYLSSIKVNGEATFAGNAFNASDNPSPVDAYGISKYEAESGLFELGKITGMEIVCIRPTLVYGPGVKANFLSMMNWVWRGIPLPFGGMTQNRRSFIFLDNLVDLITTCITHPAAANQVFLASDDEDLSTADLLHRMTVALGGPTRLFKIPSSLIKFIARLVGRGDMALRLCGSLRVDIRKTKDLLDWTPPVSVNEGLRQTADYYLKMRH